MAAVAATFYSPSLEFMASLGGNGCEIAGCSEDGYAYWYDPVMCEWVPFCRYSDPRHGTRVVRAVDENEARQLAGGILWLDPRRSSCASLTADGPSGIVA